MPNPNITAVEDFVSRETLAKLGEYQQLVIAENEHQNLVSRGTLERFWERHVVDSAQLARLILGSVGDIADIGSGAGLPGMVVAAIMPDRPVTLIEPRKLRADFLARVADHLGMQNVSVVQKRAESVNGQFGVIMARAVAPLDKLLDISRHLSTKNTLYLFPKGRSALSELAVAKSAWQGSFRLEPSATSDESFVVVAQGISPRKR